MAQDAPQFDIYLYFFKKTGSPLFFSVVPPGTGPVLNMGQAIANSVLIGHDPEEFGLVREIAPMTLSSKLRNYRFENGQVVVIPDEELRAKTLERLERMKSAFFV